MEAAQLTIDWRQPWLAPFASLRDALDGVAPPRAGRDGAASPRSALRERPQLHAALAVEPPRSLLCGLARERRVRTRDGHPVRFVAAGDAGATPYEAHIAATGRVPTRDNLHDLFNAFAWLAFPRTKAALNARQAEEIARAGIGARRGPVRDAATLIDESGLLLAARDSTAFAALAARDWRALLVDGRQRWGRDVVPFAFGHALLEKLAGPYKAVTAAVICLPWAAGDPIDAASVDAAAAAFVARSALRPSLLGHLPVLGIPGWWAPNEDAAFYDDPRVFRPALSA